MARDASGTYTRVSNSFTAPVAGTTISPTDADAFWDELESEMTDSLSRSGKGGMSADLDMNNNDINEIKTAVFQGSTSGNTTVIATAIAGTTTLTLPAATDTLVGKATTDTLTNKSVSLATNTLTGTTAEFNTALSDGSFATLAGSEALTNKTYNGNIWTAGTGTLTIAAGKTFTASNTLTLAGSDGTTLTFQGTDTYVGRTTTDTLTNKTLTSPTINAATVTGVVDAGGATSFEIPNDAAPTVNADGEIAVDTSVADFSHGIIKYYGGEELGIVAMPVAEFTTPLNGAVPTYNSTTDEFELAVPGGGGDLLAANNLSDVASAATSFANIKQAASDTATGVLEIAVQSEMETGTDTTRAVVPGRQQYHPSAAKAWAMVTQSGTMALNASYNMSSVTDAGTGNSQFNLTTSFSSATYGGGAVGQQLTNNTEILAGLYSPATGSFRILNNDTSGTARDTVAFATAHGDQ